METTLHQQLKDHFSGPGAVQEARLGRFRIDVVRNGRLIEIQHSGLGAIRDKIRSLLVDHRVDVVKPLVARKTIVKLDAREGRELSRRLSPRRSDHGGIFQELLHFSNVFPHPKLRLLTPLIEIEEIRYPGHGRRRRWRANDFVIQDQIITSIQEPLILKSKVDLLRLLPADLPRTFDTAILARLKSIPVWQARQIAWVLRMTGGVTVAGKSGNRILYRTPRSMRTISSTSQCSVIT